MKHLIISILSCFVLLSCNSPQMEDQEDMDDRIAANLEHIIKEYPWIAELIENAETDGSGNYRGSIWIEKYKGESIFVTNMRMWDPLHVFCYFTLEGDPLTIDDSELLTMKFDRSIYSNVGEQKIKIPDIDNSITACGVKQPQKNLPWLAIMIIKSEAAMGGTSHCSIWLEEYKGLDIFVVERYVSSVLYYIYDCSGNLRQINEEEVQEFYQSLKFNQKIYSFFSFY